MKNLSILLIALLAFVATAANYENTLPNGYTLSTSNGHTPQDVVVFELTDTDTTDEADTLAASAVSFIGPIGLTNSSKQPMFDYMKLYTEPGVVASGDSFSISYQLLPTIYIADTVSSWTVIDTITTAGKISTAISLANNPAVSIVFQLKNVDATRVEIQDVIRAVFQKAQTYEESVR